MSYIAILFIYTTAWIGFTAFKEKIHDNGRSWVCHLDTYVPNDIIFEADI